MEFFGVFGNLQFTPSSFLEFIIHHWTVGGKTRDILLLPSLDFDGVGAEGYTLTIKIKN